MSCKITVRQAGNVTILDITGRITLEGDGAALLRKNILNELAKGNKNILLNMGDVSYIDSSGIAEMVSGFTNTANRGGELRLLNLTARVKDLLQITKLYTVFEAFEDETLALRSFAPVQAIPQNYPNQPEY